MNRDDIVPLTPMEQLLTSIPPLGADDLSSEQYDNLLALTSHAGFKTLIGLTLGARRTFEVQLVGTPLSDAAAQHRASVLQGQIQGIDALRSTLLSVLDAVKSNDDNGATQ